METIMEYVRAFLVGGAFCALAQILIDRTRLTPARILVTYVVCGVMLGAIGLYKPLIDFAGAGATLPISGFGYLISRGVREAIERDGFMGIITGGITATSGGITAALFFGLLASFIFKSKPRNT